MKDQTIDKAVHKPQISFTIRTEGKIYFVLVENIACVYLEEETVYLVDFNSDKHPIAKTVNCLENLLPAQQFHRINRQTIINRKAIKEIAPYANQRLVLYLSVATPEPIIVPRLKVRHFLDWMESG